MKQLKNWTATYGIDGSERSVRLVVTESSDTAHVSAATGDPQTLHFPSHWPAVTACDRIYDDAADWRSPGYYDAADVQNVLLNVHELPASQISFKRVCKRCVKVAWQITGIDLMSEMETQ